MLVGQIAGERKRDSASYSAEELQVIMAMRGEKQPLGDALDHFEATTDTVSHEKDVAQQKDRDYAGAVAKTDPKEIKLVRKLDFRIMVNP